MKKHRNESDSQVAISKSVEIITEGLELESSNKTLDAVVIGKKDSKTTTPQSQNDNKKTMVIVLIAVLVLVTLIGLTIWRVYQNSAASKDKAGDLTLENVSPEIKDQLTGKLVYAKTIGQGATKYYSPSLDALLEVDDETESVSESSDLLNLYIKSAGYNTPFYITIQKTDLSIDEFADSKCSLADNCNKSSLSEQNSVIEVRFNYDRKAFFTTENKTEKVFAAAYQLSDVEGYVMYMYVVGENDNMINDYSDDALKVFSTLDTNVEGVDNELMVSLEDGILSIPLNRKDWTVDVSSTGTYFSAHHRKNSSAETEESYLASGYISASVESLYGSTLDERHASNSKIADYEKEYGAKYTAENEKVIIGGVEFLHSMYEMVQYDTQPDLITYKASYTAVLETSQKVIAIQYTLYSNKDKSTAAGKAILEVLPKFQFSDKEIAFVNTGEYGDVLGANTMSIDKVAFLAQPSVAQIFNKTCVNVVAEKAYTSSMYVGKTYEICGAGTGTGFYVNGDGYMVTNAHVAAPNPTDILVGAIYGTSYDPDGFASDFYYIALEIIDAEYGVTNFTKDQLIEMVMTYAPKLVIIVETDNGISIDSTKYTNYVQADEAFSVNGSVLDLYNADVHYSSEVIDHNEIESTAKMEFDYLADGTMPSIGVADLALLKVDTKGNAVSSLPLSDASSVLVGSGIRVIGYPGAADNNMLFSTESSRIPTLTTGTISAIKPNATNAFNLVQFDASISGGNSGGPILNENGSVVAVATYGVAPNQAAADYNAGVSVSEVTALLERNNIVGGSSELSKLLEKTVFYLDSHYYKWAVENLDKAITMNPDLESTLSPLKAYANSQIEDGQDKSPLFAIGELYIGVVEIALFAGVVVVAVVVIVVVVMLKKKGGKGKVMATNSMPVQQSAPQTTVFNTPLPTQAPVAQPVVSPAAPVQVAAAQPVAPQTPTLSTQLQSTPVQPTVESQPTMQPAQPVMQERPVQQAPAQPASPFSPNLSSQSTVTAQTPVAQPLPQPMTNQAPVQQPAPNPMYGLNQPVAPVSPPGMFQSSQPRPIENQAVATSQPGTQMSAQQAPVNPTQPQVPLN